MKTYNSPKTQITDCKTMYMLMSGNVSGYGLKGIAAPPAGGATIETPIDIF